jgi:hypothetical protein
MILPSGLKKGFKLDVAVLDLRQGVVVLQILPEAGAANQHGLEQGEDLLVAGFRRELAPEQFPGLVVDLGGGGFVADAVGDLRGFVGTHERQ